MNTKKLLNHDGKKENSLNMSRLRNAEWKKRDTTLQIITLQKPPGDKKMTSTINEYAIWLYLRDRHCSFLRQRRDIKMCTNKYTVNGSHTYVFCPLIAEEHLTVKLEETNVVAFKKNPKVRIPSQMWERIELPEEKEEGMQELRTYTEQMVLHPTVKEAVLTKGEQFYDIAEELRRTPPPEVDLLEEDILAEDWGEDEDLDEEISDDDLDELEEELLDEDLEEVD